MTRCLVKTDAAEAEVYLHGAHVTHYRPAGEEPVLFLSDKAVFDGKSPIRGGVPICFPWFGGNGPSDDSPSHGFARTTTWSLGDAKRDGEDVLLTFVLASTEATQDLWGGDFVFTYTVRVGRSLGLSAKVVNVGDDALPYELALHTYLAVRDVREVRLTGFAGSNYVDQLRDGERIQQAGEPVIDAEVDRIYQDHAADVTVHDAGRQIVVSKSGSRSTVLWNPHGAKAKRMADFGDDEWPRMLCVESAAIGHHSIELGSGESHALSVTIS
jgi:glucose-6-phosphate 1-epimerase